MNFWLEMDTLIIDVDVCNQPFKGLSRTRKIGKLIKLIKQIGQTSFSAIWELGGPR